MPLHFTIVLGLILVAVLIVLWLLIVLDLDNQRRLKLFNSSKVKPRKYKK